MSVQLNKNDILDTLRRVIHPANNKDIVELNMVKDLLTEDHKIAFKLEFPTANDPLKGSLQKACTKVLTDTFGEETEIKIEAIFSARPSVKPSNKYLPDVKNIIAIASGKGGVGKSTVAVNLAIATASTGARVGLIDADIFGPSIPKMLDTENENPHFQKINGKDFIIPVEKYGIKTLSMGFFVNPSESTVWRGPMASNAFQQLMRDAWWGELDYMFVDLPPGTSDIHLTLVQSVAVTGAVIVSTPQDVALADVVKGINMFRTPGINVPVLGIIENMSWFTPAELPDYKYYIFGKNGCSKLADEFGIPLLGQIPLIQSICEGSDNGQPAILEKGEASEVYKTIADNLVVQLLKRNTELEPTKIVEITKKRNNLTH